MKPLSIYIHIPFCQSKCYYCDFLSAQSSEEEQADYIESLLHEIEIEAPSYRDYEVRTIFIGGGTPSVLPAENIVEILCKLKTLFQFSAIISPEISIEINPGKITSDMLSQYRGAGINRLSFGLQSTFDEELKMLGRIHTYQEFLSTYQNARNLGFDNINIDLISSIPNQSITSWKDTLRRVILLEPEHISAYGLIIEPGTPFHEKYGLKKSDAIESAEEEQESEIYHATKSVLESNNNMRYEISNYARPGYECRHNLTYWRRGDYVGFGLGASSLIDNKRWSNIVHLKSYITIYQGKCRPLADNKTLKNVKPTVKEKLQVLSIKAQIEEFMFLGLRLTEGIHLTSFKKIFGRDINEYYAPILFKLKEQKLIHIDEKTIALTPYGIDVSNYVLAHFLFDEDTLLFTKSR